jgi:hypothetical protein
MVQTRKPKGGEKPGSASKMAQEGAGEQRPKATEVTNEAKEELATIATKMAEKTKAAKEELPPMNRTLLAGLNGLLLALLHYAIDAGLNHQFIAAPVWRQVWERFIRSWPSKFSVLPNSPPHLNKLSR